jgi:hypothetical protein
MRLCVIRAGILLILVFSITAWADDEVFFRDEFHDLHDWELLYFPKIKQHTTYEIVTKNGRTYLKTQSKASASALVSKKTFNPFIYQYLRWRWKVENIYTRWDGKEKSGDDYPIRIYVMFPYDPKYASLSERVLYSALKTIHGQYPPYRTLNYVWASDQITDDVFSSPYTSRVKIIVRENGKAKVGQWIDEKANIIDDYKKAFGKAPPDKAVIAIMNDSDNTGEAAVSYVEYIEISK